MGTNYIKIDWDFDPLIDMNLSRFKERITWIPIEDVNPALIRQLSAASLKIKPPQAFYSPPSFCSSCHVDGNIENLAAPWVSRCKINWISSPVALNEWYEILPEDRNKTLHSVTGVGTTYANFNLAPKKVIESARLAGWYIIEAGIPHKVSNHSPDHRWCISIGLSLSAQELGWPTMNSIRDRLKI